MVGVLVPLHLISPAEDAEDCVAKFTSLTGESKRLVSLIAGPGE